MEQERQAYDKLVTLLSQPTAPFREQAVRAHVVERLQEAGVPWCEDPFGNLVVGESSLSDWRRRLVRQGRGPLRLFIAHMDHPGFHGMRWEGEDRLHVRWLGGSPVRHLRGAEVWLALEGEECGTGRITSVRIAEHGHGMEQAWIRVFSKAWKRRPAARRLYGGFRFRRPVWKRGARLYARVLDDLVGVHAILETAEHLWKERHPGRTRFAALLTRGEEVGFVGAVAHFEKMRPALRGARAICVSLEASRTLPGAVAGKGAVIRLGDRRTLFDTRGTRILEQVAENVLDRPAQRRVMEGGSCEATAAAAWGLPVIGLTLPLGNYHNQCLDGGEGCNAAGGVAPEYIDMRDLEDYCRLCIGLMDPGLSWRDPWQEVRTRLVDNLKDYRKFLEEDRQ